MRLADFIEANTGLIADGAQAFAATLAGPLDELDPEALRDHMPEILAAIALDLRSDQTAAEQQAKSEGRAPPADGPESAASIHGRLRARIGFNLDQTVAEYRALRAAVLRLWISEHPLAENAAADIIRFNEAIDQAIAESVADFSKETESWRQVFLGVLGHDLRGPLSVIVITAELISRMAADTPVSRQVDRIIRSGQRMAKLLDDLLDYSRSSLGLGIPIHRAECDLEQAVQEEVDLLRGAWPALSIRLKAQGATWGEFDASRVREALSNLVSNAAKYGDTSADIVVSLSGHAEAVELVVCNDGQTLSSDVLKGLFEPLQRGPAAASSHEKASLGLGLFIVREIARAHGGEVNAESADGVTKFIMRLPRQG